jgi:transposase, IS6 family
MSPGDERFRTPQKYFGRKPLLHLSGLAFSLSYRDAEELLMERALPADHTTIWRWVQRYAPELNKRCRRELIRTNGSWRVDETISARVDAGGTFNVPSIPPAPRSTSGFPLSETRSQPSSSFRQPCRLLVIPRPRVITVDGNPSYPNVIAELKRERKLGRRCCCRTCPYLNHVA